VWTALAWGGVIAFPFILILTLTIGNRSNGGVLDLGVLGIPLSYLLPAMVVALPAALLRRRPLTTLALMLAGSSIVTTTVHSWDTGYLTDIRSMHLLAIDLAVGFIAATRPRQVSVVVAVAALCVQIGTGYANPSDLALDVRPEIPTLAMVTAWMIGNSVRARRRYAEALRSQAAVQTVTTERLRIARELHDMVAHSIGIIAIQAGMGSRVMDTQPAEAREALRAIESTSRETLSGLRRTLVALRQADPVRASELAPLTPAPGLADVERLATTTTDAGVRVDVSWKGQRRPLPADIDLAAFRIVQEAVTNVVRHAGARHCRVAIDYGDEELSVEVIDAGRATQGAAVGTCDGVAVGSGAGFGITGMRERVSLLHGHFSAGPRPEGGFRVTARLPLPEPVTAPANPR
jgi:signal transduction histidine kinase